MEDIRDILFEEIASKRFRAVLTAERSGVISGVEEAYACAKELGIDLELCKAEGAEVSHGERFGNFLGTPKQIALAEERLIGTLAKASGIATASRTAVRLADGKTQIVSGSWKKMPPAIKQMVGRRQPPAARRSGSASRQWSIWIKTLSECSDRSHLR